MGAFRLDRLLDFLTSTQFVVGLLWAGLAVFSVTLLVLMQTRWGQSRPLRKCLVLSVLAHLLLAGYATTVQIVSATPVLEEPVIRVSFVEMLDEPTPDVEESPPEEEPWEKLAHDRVPQPVPVDLQREEPAPSAEPQREIRAEEVRLRADLPLDQLPFSDDTPPEPQLIDLPEPAGRSSSGKSAEQIEVPAPQRREVDWMSPPDQSTPERRAPQPETQAPPIRTPNTDIPTALLQQDLPLPNLADPPTTDGPADSLAGLTDRLPQPMRLEAGKSDTDDQDTSTPKDDATEADENELAKAKAGKPWSPSIALPDGKHADIEATPELPSGNTTVVVIPQPPDDGQTEARPQLPNIYKLRVSPDRSREARLRGATAETEAAVEAALKWLADNQSADGRWDAGNHGAGRELTISGRNRRGAGVQADTGVTGLALLAFLASGHTHREGLYRENVRRGLVYLLKEQAADGNLAGQATPYARMYCHCMAAFALSEALGMTADERLRNPVRHAVGYSLAAQHPSLGGWRYLPNESGDTSQCGWQLMALKSAELAGIPIPVENRNGVIRFLRSVASGKHGGLAAYRPEERASRPMTAEALVCWQFLGMPRENPAGNEAGDYLLGELPGQGRDNLYYWYYGTLSMYQLQGTYWERWNAALQETLLQRQQKAGPMAGSWGTDTLWGGYGGRVYTTSLATLCLEVYYRFLPLYINAAPDSESP